MTPISKKKGQAASERASPRPSRRETRTISDSSEHTTSSSGFTNTTCNSQTPCFPYRTTTAQPAIHDAEATLSLRQCIDRYSKAITWSVLFSLTLVMEGYSTILVPNLYSLDPFLRQFGTQQRNGSYEIGAAWQSALVNGALAGQIVGLLLAGWLAERIGYRRTLMVGLMAMVGFVSITFFATSKLVLLVGQCLLGAPWGVFQTISTTYAVDILPVRLRGYLTTYVNACWVLGQLIASVVLRSMLSIDSQWAYRIPFGLQWAFPVPIFIVVALAPESPWWLVRQSRFEEAHHSLCRLRKQAENESDSDFNAGLEETLKQVVLTNNKEKEAQSGTRYLDCFKGVDRRRTEIACMVWTIQTLCGSTFMGFSTYFYEQAGLSAKHAFTMSLAQFALGLFGVVASWFLLSYLGRRTIYLSGQVLTLLCVLLIGILACIPYPHTSSTRSATTTSRSPSPGSAIPWAIAALLLVFTAVYDATIGPVCYTLVSEVPSTRLRSKTIVLARNAYNISGIATNLVTPRMLNPTAWAWGAKAGFFWAATASVGLAWSWCRLPETKDRTFAQIDVLFRDETGARKFKRTRVEDDVPRRDASGSSKGSET
ncbi:sugar transporter [Didymella exigua CBS 183.55]|uniref:Sugar transporter n=1 Tax=Didymella exigua CBS 183.55 TaxID=1150837 RepID=A0A6A5RXY2_9PLEO|nr:sugar transporter [Didymella exigua CBS 183.55]KAF1931156.1 sugar transporter [Didymella exigua CBS 183.55]